MTDTSAALVKSLCDVLHLWAEQVETGHLATADLPSPWSMRNLTLWQDAWNRLPQKRQAHLERWWHADAKGIPV